MTTVIMRTSEGDITIDLFDDKAPNTVANFLGLATLSSVKLLMTLPRRLSTSSRPSKPIRWIARSSRP